MPFSEIQYLGHSAVLIKGTDGVIGIDPWLKDNPRCPKEFKEPKQLNLIVLTHGHSDHAGDAVRLARSTNATIAAIFELAGIMAEEGVAQEKLVPMSKGGTVRVGPYSVSLTNAFHSSSYTGKRGTVYAGEACGTVVSDGTTSIYHAGDTCLFSDMKLIGEYYKPKVSIVPMGNHFTMDPKQAAQAAAWTGCEIAIPMHYRTFDLLTGTVEEFAACCETLGVQTKILEPGQTLTLR